jgi:hypothetical protein
VTRYLEGTVEPSRHVAGRCLAWRLTALMEAGCGLASPGSCDRWLPDWLPVVDTLCSVRMKEIGIDYISSYGIPIPSSKTCALQAQIAANFSSASLS